jgi:hypothetical protein
MANYSIKAWTVLKGFIKVCGNEVYEWIAREKSESGPGGVRVADQEVYRSVGGIHLRPSR